MNNPEEFTAVSQEALPYWNSSEVVPPEQLAMNTELTDDQKVRRTLGVLGSEAVAGLVAISAVLPNMAQTGAVMAGTATAIAVTGMAFERHYNK